MSKVADISRIILARIRTNAYSGKIPGERSLATEFSVDFKTANRAIDLLVEQGILVRRRGLGTFIAEVDQRRNLTIGLCFFKHSDPGSDPVFTRFLSGMNTSITALGSRLVITALRDVANPGQAHAQQAQAFRKQVLAADPDGLIYLGNIDTGLIDQLRAERPTIVATQVPEELGFDTVRRDIGAGVALAIEHLHGLGHRRIAFATYEYGLSTTSYDLHEKERGYRASVAALGMREQVFRITHPPEDRLVRLVREADPRPTAIVCAENDLALSLVTHGPECGLALPGDLAVVSFDDGDMGLHTRPTLSSIRAFGEDLARLTVSRLLDRLDGRVAGRISEVLPCPFIVRQSSGSAQIVEPPH